MAMEDSQFPDAPETPGPIFAYRAFKGFIFGSPNEDDERNKENIVEQRSPSKSSTKQLHTQQALTPQKRKRGDGNGRGDVLSPVKSILRPTGVATPRALHLQRGNVGVTFKDIRKSMSPEMKAKGPRGTAAMTSSPSKSAVQPRDTVATKLITEMATAMGEVAPLKKKANLASALAIPLQPTTVHFQKSEPSANSVTLIPENASFDIDEYIRRTEKEMRKLVRYGQKMREYARKQDEENGRLMQALLECRKENERLSKAEEDRVRRASATKPADGGEAGKARAFGGGFGKMEDDKMDRRNQLRAPQVVPKLNPGSLPTLSINLGNPDVNGKASGNLSQQKEKPLEKQPPLSAETVFQRDRQSSARLPPDRLAAARERIRMKSEKRKVSELSQVDWADL